MAYEEEMSSIKAAKPAPTKVTRAEIASKVEKQARKIIFLSKRIDISCSKRKKYFVFK